MSLTLIPEQTEHLSQRSWQEAEGQEPKRTGSTNGLAKFLGWFSVGLGLVEAASPHRFARLIGAEDDPVLIRALGVRELASGIGILAGRHPDAWLWSRVAGDGMDLALLGRALSRAENGRRPRLIAATAAVAGIMVMDVLAGKQHLHS